MSRRDYDDNLAYGSLPGEESDRGLLGDLTGQVGSFTGRFFGKKPQSGPSTGPQASQSKPSTPSASTYSPADPSQGSKSTGGMAFLFDKVHSAVHDIAKEIKNRTAAGPDTHAHSHESGQCTHETCTTDHRFHSYAPKRANNNAKWYVDGCTYMWAVSRALEEAKESIWILDWWLSPELYLRRPPAKYENYRIDHMLKAAAERGVKVKIIVYKEVTQALTLSSSHTKHALEDLHENIAVFRHPDHVPDAAVVSSSFWSSISNLSLNAATASKLPGDTLKAIYGMHEDTVLYWAHHEKLCLVDGRIAFMGGLDLCYGRWDTNQHSIADAHPGNLDLIVFPGQDYNNARIMDFQDVANWQNNKLDRRESGRMGWSDIALSLSGPVVRDLQQHFAERWNFIYTDKYSHKDPGRYGGTLPVPAQPGHKQQHRGLDEGAEGERGFGREHDDGHEGERGFFGGGQEGGLRGKMRHRIGQGMQELQGRYGVQVPGGFGGHGQGPARGGDTICQMTRSCAKWSHGATVEHSIANAYIDTIKNSKHFVYIENQFFITATGDKQKPIKNMIGAAMVERIVRAARNGERYYMIIMMPAVPAFAGDLKGDDALGTRAIMEFQYDSISRGGNSIMETIAREGVNPMDYIRFYNLRSYDRINASAAMSEAEKKSGVSYEDARKEHDVAYGGLYQQPLNQQGQPGYDQQAMYEMDAGYRESRGYGQGGAYEQYQAAAQEVGDRKGLGSGRWDSVAECYMLNGQDIRNVPWEHGNVPEIDAFVSEELYIHSKLLIADDRIVICGSANLNDRSQLGDHDSEIAIVIEDQHEIDSAMADRSWRATKFAASLRRQIFRKHLGLVPPQVIDCPDENYEPVGVPNAYDWGSREDQLVADPLSNEFLNLWNQRARTNTEAFNKLFHCVPCDNVRSWKQYDEWYSKYFAEKKEGEQKKPAKYKVGHIVREEFAPGEEGLRQVKDVLASIKGTLVEMPLLFLKDEDIAKEGVGLNAFTEELYT